MAVSSATREYVTLMLAVTQPLYEYLEGIQFESRKAVPASFPESHIELIQSKVHRPSTKC
jgi:hypothetical protein